MAKTTSTKEAPSTREQARIDKAAERARLEKLFGVEPGTCLSGSGVSPKKGLFAPGGDAKLKSRLLGEYRSGNAKAREKASKLADALGWGRFLTDLPVKESVDA